MSRSISLEAVNLAPKRKQLPTQESGPNPILIVLLVIAGGIFAAAGWLATRPVDPEGPEIAGSAQPLASRDSANQDATPGSGDRPNVVIMLVDTLRVDRLGAYGCDKPTSPNIDGLAKQGVVFESCNSTAPWTLPSVVSMHSSTFPCEHRVLKDGQRLSSSIKTLAERFKESGYATASFHANPYAGRMSGLDRGFDFSKGMPFVNGATVEQWLATSPGSPFFLNIHNIEPHNPYDVAKQFIEPFGQAGQAEKQSTMDRYLNFRKLTRVDFENNRPLGTTDNTAEQLAALKMLDDYKPTIDLLYDAAVLKADFRVGQVLTTLVKKGLWDNTLFVLVSDHGEELGDHGGWMHDQSVYQELIHVPLIVRFPGNRFAGQRVKQTVSLVDLAPTLLAVIGQRDRVEGMRGQSMLPLVAGRSNADAEEMRVTSMRINRKKYYKPYKEGRGDLNVVVRKGSYKGIWNVETKSFELYNLAADPKESAELAQKQPELVDEMQQFARAWLTECGQSAPKTPSGSIDSMDNETLKALRSLGYVE